jgi:hypothetical protein
MVASFLLAGVLLGGGKAEGPAPPRAAPPGSREGIPPQPLKTVYFSKPATAPEPAAAPAVPSGEPTRAAAPRATLAAARTAALQQPADLRGLGEDATGYQIQLEPPGPDRLFRREAEGRWQERLRQEARQRPSAPGAGLERLVFPEEAVLSTERYVPRAMPPQKRLVEPAYVCYRPLWFEEKNSERYGWDLGLIQPFVSVGHFYKDVLLLPYHVATGPFRQCECSAGYCLPGDPVPYLLYPPELSLAGAFGESATLLFLFAVFP